MAYELLCEGMETGGAGMKGAVFSGGDLEYAGPEPPEAAGAHPTGMAPALPADVAGAGSGAAAAPSDETGAAGVSGAPARASHTPTSAAVKDGAELSLLDRGEVEVLLRSAAVQAALRDLAADPAAVMNHTGNAALLGLLFTLATEGWDQPISTLPTASAGAAAAGGMEGGGYHRAGIVDQAKNVEEAEVAD
eukprot:scaffold8818_cov129-Isochrysis_galbana.AAC.4